MKDNIIRKIEEKTGIPDIVDILADRLSGSAFNSLLLEVYSRRSKKITPPALLQQYRKNRFVHPADTDMIGLLEKELEVLKLCREHQFMPIELSPLAQFGACSVVAKADQKKIISAMRHSEVMADATNAIALHIANNRGHGDVLRFSTVHRHVRAQPLQDPRFSPHFKIGCLVSAGKDKGNREFELSSLEEHFRLWAALLQEIFHISDIRFKLQPREGFFPEALTSLRERTGFAVSIDPDSPTNEYYKCLQFKTVIRLGEQDIEIADGGFTDWTQQLLDNRKERLLISGFGLSLLYQLAR